MGFRTFQFPDSAQSYTAAESDSAQCYTARSPTLRSVILLGVQLCAVKHCKFFSKTILVYQGPDGFDSRKKYKKSRDTSTLKGQCQKNFKHYFLLKRFKLGPIRRYRIAKFKTQCLRSRLLHRQANFSFNMDNGHIHIFKLLLL